MWNWCVGLVNRSRNLRTIQRLVAIGDKHSRTSWGKALAIEQAG
jgi:hypothetical protein